MEGKDFEQKYFYITLQEEDGKYEGIIGFGLNWAIMKDGKGMKIFKDGNVFEGEWKITKEIGEEL